MKNFVSICFLIFVSGTGLYAQDSLGVYLFEGRRSLKAGNEQMAIENFKAVLRFNPNHIEANKKISFVYSGQGKQKLARQHLLKCLKYVPLDIEVMNGIGVTYSAEDKSAEAVKYFEMAVGIDSNFAVSQFNLGQEQARLGKISLALLSLRKADQLKPGDKITLLALANSHAAASTYDSSEMYYKRSAQAGGGDFELFNRMAIVLQRQNKLDEAAKSYRRALTYDVNNAMCLRALGQIYLELEKYSEAREQFRRLLAQDSAFAPAWIGLGAGYALDDMYLQADSILRMMFAKDSAAGFQFMEVVKSYMQKKK